MDFQNLAAGNQTNQAARKGSGLSASKARKLSKAMESDDEQHEDFAKEEEKEIQIDGIRSQVKSGSNNLNSNPAKTPTTNRQNKNVQFTSASPAKASGMTASEENESELQDVPQQIVGPTQDHEYYEEDENYGASPINLPDPSMFSDLQEEQNGSSQANQNEQRQLEIENEKRKLEQIYMVAGEEKKTHISIVELYGFFSWNLSAFVFIIYMVWAFVPNEILNDFGIYYIPDKYYAIALPLWFAVSMFTVLQLYCSVCMYMTPNIDSYETLQDKHSILKNPAIEQDAPDQGDTMNKLDQHILASGGRKFHPNGQKSQSHNIIKPTSASSRQRTIANAESMRADVGSKKQMQTNDKAKIADVFELPMTVVNNVIYQGVKQQYDRMQQNIAKTNLGA